jgi:hypothetical protein
MATEEQVRNYARQLWEKAGRPEGRIWNSGMLPNLN